MDDHAAAEADQEWDEVEPQGAGRAPVRQFQDGQLAVHPAADDARGQVAQVVADQRGPGQRLPRPHVDVVVCHACDEQHLGSHRARLTETIVNNDTWAV
ncbi:hypothetical protein ACOBQX_07265 [Actinokineospora sp. G85]|uniref:hypothetical protein n=1 Tax=Actinokineospora sp. G85 TaxID=3406626 RepID=UPI003C756B9A